MTSSNHSTNHFTIRRYFVLTLTDRVSNNSELKGAHFRILPKKVAIFAKNVRFLYYKEANKKRHLPLKVAPMCAKAHIIRNSVHRRPFANHFHHPCLLSCHIRSPKPHADWSKNAWRVISKKEKLFSEHLFWAVNWRMCPPTAEYFEKMAGIMNFMYF